MTCEATRVPYRIGKCGTLASRATIPRAWQRASDKLCCDVRLSQSSRRHKIGHEIVQITVNIQKAIQRQSSH
jgi:hypothetical protein